MQQATGVDVSGPMNAAADAVKDIGGQAVSSLAEAGAKGLGDLAAKAGGLFRRR